MFNPAVYSNQKTTEIISNIGFNFLVEAIIMGIVLLVFWKKRTWILPILIIGVTAQLWLFGRGNLISSPLSVINLPSSDIDLGIERTVSGSDVFDYIGPHVYFNHLRVRQPFGPDLSDQELKDFSRLTNEIQMLPANLHMFNNWYSASGYSAVVLKNFADYWQSSKVNSVSIPEVTDSRLKTMGVTTVLTGYPSDFLETKSGFKKVDQDSTRIIYKQDANDRAFLLNSGTVEINQYSPTYISLTADSWESNQLVLTDAYYPGWVAKVDGAPVEILPFDSAFRQINLEPGKHQVEFWYQPKSVRIGGWISLFTSLGILGIFFYENIILKKFKDKLN